MISFGTLLVTLVSTLIFPLVLKPLVEYSVTEPEIVQNTKNISESKVRIYNYGLAPAKNVVGAMEGENIVFSRFASEPFLSNNFGNDSVRHWGYFEIGILPPGSQTEVIALLDFSNSSLEQPVTTYLRSDETVGHTDLIKNLTIGGYIAYLMGAPLVVLLLLRYKYGNVRRDVLSSLSPLFKERLETILES